MFRKIFILLVGLPLFVLAESSRVEETNTRIINSMVALVSDDFLSAGQYKVNDGDAELTIYHIPLKHHFKPFYNKFNFFINGSFGYATIEEDQHIAPSLAPDTYEARIKMYKGGVGLRYEAYKNLYLDAGYSLIYTKYNPNYSYNTPASIAIIKPLFDSVVNKKQTNWTSELSLSLRYEQEIAGFLPYILAEYKWYHTRSDLELDNEHKATSQDSILRTRLGSFTPSLFELNQKELKLNAFLGRNYFYGDLVSVMRTDYYDSYGGGVYISFKDKEAWLKKLGLIAEWTDGENFDGFNIGLDINFNF